MTAPTHRCESCGIHQYLAGVTEVAPAIWMCHGCHARPPLADTAAQWVRDWQRDGMHAAENTGAPIDQTTRTLLTTWRADMRQQEHGGKTW